MDLPISLRLQPVGLMHTDLVRSSLKPTETSLPQVWGEDADQWNPDRFTKIEPAKQVRVGMFSNL